MSKFMMSSFTCFRRDTSGLAPGLFISNEQIITEKLFNATDYNKLYSTHWAIDCDHHNSYFGKIITNQFPVSTGIQFGTIESQPFNPSIFTVDHNYTLYVYIRDEYRYLEDYIQNHITIRRVD